MESFIRIMPVCSTTANTAHLDSWHGNPWEWSLHSSKHSLRCALIRSTALPAANRFPASNASVGNPSVMIFARKRLKHNPGSVCSSIHCLASTGKMLTCLSPPCRKSPSIPNPSSSLISATDTPGSPFLLKHSNPTILAKKSPPSEYYRDI